MNSNMEVSQPLDIPQTLTVVHSRCDYLNQQGKNIGRQCKNGGRFPGNLLDAKEHANKNYCRRHLLLLTGRQRFGGSHSCYIPPALRANDLFNKPLSRRENIESEEIMDEGNVVRPTSCYELKLNDFEAQPTDSNRTEAYKGSISEPKSKRQKIEFVNEGPKNMETDPDETDEDDLFPFDPTDPFEMLLRQIRLGGGGA